jgi:hypothetical protein
MHVPFLLSTSKPSQDEEEEEEEKEKNGNKRLLCWQCYFFSPSSSFLRFDYSSSS